MAAGNPPRRRRGLPRVSRRVGGRVHPPRPPVGAGRLGRRACGAEPSPARAARRAALAAADPVSAPPGAGRAAATRGRACGCSPTGRPAPPPRRRPGAAGRAGAAPRIVPDGHGVAGARRRGWRVTPCHVSRAAAGSGGCRASPPPARRGVAPAGGEYPRAGRAATTDGGPRTAGRVLASGLGGGCHPLYGRSSEWWGWGEHAAATLPTGRTVGVGGMGPRHPATRAVTAVARH